jgi:hypothetical protein
VLTRIEGQRDEMPPWITELRKANRQPSDTALGGLITEVFLRTVSRPPTVEEIKQARADLAAAGDPVTGLRDLLWVMLNTREFTVNH